jgi:hypothetical protein
MAIYTFLRQPYPSGDPNLAKAAWQSLLFGLFAAFVLVVFQPFGSYNWQHPYKALILSGYCTVATLNYFPKLLRISQTAAAPFAEAR